MILFIQRRIVGKGRIFRLGIIRVDHKRIHLRRNWFAVLP